MVRFYLKSSYVISLKNIIILSNEKKVANNITQKSTMRKGKCTISKKTKLSPPNESYRHIEKWREKKQENFIAAKEWPE